MRSISRRLGCYLLAVGLAMSSVSAAAQPAEAASGLAPAPQCGPIYTTACVKKPQKPNKDGCDGPSEQPNGVNDRRGSLPETGTDQPNSGGKAGSDNKNPNNKQDDKKSADNKTDNKNSKCDDKKKTTPKPKKKKKPACQRVLYDAPPLPPADTSTNITWVKYICAVKITADKYEKKVQSEPADKKNKDKSKKNKNKNKKVKFKKLKKKLEKRIDLPGTPWNSGHPATVIQTPSVETALKEGIDELEFPLLDPNLGPENHDVFVHVPYWFWLENPGAMTLHVETDGVEINGLVSLASTQWKFNEPAGEPGTRAGNQPVDPVLCQGAGSPPPLELPTTYQEWHPECGYAFNWASRAARTNGSCMWQVAATANWVLNWSSPQHNGGAPGLPQTLPQDSSTRGVPVWEIKTRLVSNSLGGVVQSEGPELPCEGS